MIKIQGSACGGEGLQRQRRRKTTLLRERVCSEKAYVTTGSCVEPLGGASSNGSDESLGFRNATTVVGQGCPGIVWKDVLVAADGVAATRSVRVTGRVSPICCRSRRELRAHRPVGHDRVVKTRTSLALRDSYKGDGHHKAPRQSFFS